MRMLPSSSLTDPDVQDSRVRFFMEELCSRRCSDGRSGLPAEGDAELNTSRRRGSTARADHKRKGFTCRPRQPTIGISYATASMVSAGCQTERLTPVGEIDISTQPPKWMS